MAKSGVDKEAQHVLCFVFYVYGAARAELPCRLGGSQPTCLFGVALYKLHGIFSLASSLTPSAGLAGS